MHEHPQPADKATRDTGDADVPDRPPAAGPRISILDPAGTLGDPDAFRVLLTTLASEFADRSGEVRAKIVRDDEMASAHLRHKNAEGTTDVLTFDLSDSDTLDVDLLICIDEAERQARARGIPVEHELMLYIVHGILHCAGYDDDTQAHADAMHTREDELLAAIGIGPVFGLPENRR